MSDPVVFRGDPEVARQAVRVLAAAQIAAAIEDPPRITHYLSAVRSFPVNVVVAEDDAERAGAAIREWEAGQPERVAEHSRVFERQVLQALVVPGTWLAVGHLTGLVAPPGFVAFGLAWAVCLVVLARRERSE